MRLVFGISDEQHCERIESKMTTLESYLQRAGAELGAD
jgi:hypothetical protein